MSCGALAARWGERLGSDCCLQWMEVPWLGPSVFFNKQDEGMEGTWASLQVVLSWGSSRYTGGKGHPLEGLLWAGGMGCWDPPAAQPGQMLVQPLVVVVQDGAHGLRTTSSLGSGQHMYICTDTQSISIIWLKSQCPPLLLAPEQRNSRGLQPCSACCYTQLSSLW